MIKRSNEPKRGKKKEEDPGEKVEEAEEIGEEETPEITPEMCVNILVESHTLLRNMIARFGEGLTQMELNALTNGLKSIEIVLSDESVVALYHSMRLEALKRLKEEAAVKK